MATRTLTGYLPRNAAPARVPAGLPEVKTMLQAYRSRAELAELDPRLLADIGITRGQARAERRRHFWDIAPLRGSRRFASAPSLASRLRAAWQRASSRRVLATLDEAALRDMGVCRAEAEWEATKPFWRA